MGLWMFLFPWNSISLSLELDGEKMLHHHLLLDGRQMVLSMCPVFVREHCTDLGILLFHITRQAQALDKTDLVHKVCGASWSCTWCLEAPELEKQPGWSCKLSSYSEHFCICKLLAANCYCQAWSSPSVYIGVNKLEQESKWPGTPGLAYSQKKIHVHSLNFSWLQRSRNEFNILDNKQDTGLKQG